MKIVTFDGLELELYHLVRTAHGKRERISLVL